MIYIYIYISYFYNNIYYLCILNNFIIISNLFYRDVFWQGSCDDGCKLLTDKLSWNVSFSVRLFIIIVLIICLVCFDWYLFDFIARRSVP